MVGLVFLAGVGVSLWLWSSAAEAETAREELAFSRQVAARHALIRETLSGYEECLLAMRVFMVHAREVDQAKFSANAQAQLARYPGFLGLQWAPRVVAAERAAWEAAHADRLGS